MFVVNNSLFHFKIGITGCKQCLRLFLRVLAINSETEFVYVDPTFLFVCILYKEALQRSESIVYISVKGQESAKNTLRGRKVQRTP